MRDELSSALSGSADFLGLIHNNPDQFDFATEKVLQPLRLSRSKCETMKSMNAFWKQWLVRSNWARWARMEYSSHTILAHIEQETPQWRAAIDSVFSEMDRIKGMHMASTGKLGKIMLT